MLCIWTRLGEDTLLVDNSYQYDGNGNRTQKQTQDGLTRYAYDANNRLVEVAYPGMNGATDTEYLHYDHAGNRTERIRGNVHEYYHYDACNRLTEITDGIRQVKHYTYDNSGNMLSDGEMSYLYVGFGRLEQVTKADGSFQKNHYEYDAFGNTVSCEEQVHNRFRYTGEQYDPLTGQYYLRARYYNPVIARFTQEDTYYGDGLNLYTYCQNNPILYHDPTGHGTKENSPYSRNEQQYIDAGADPDTAKLATQCYPDAKSKQDLYNKYKSQGYNATDAKKLANYEIVHGEERAKNYAANNVKKSGPDYTVTSPRDNINTDWRTQNRLNAQKKAGAGKSGSSSIVEIVDEEKGTFIIKDWSDYPDDYVPVPDQNKVWTFLEGDEYNSARDSANIFNRNMRAADPYYANNGLEIHEIEPVKMGGSPTDINNKTAIQSQVHRRYVTPWWNKIRDEVKKGLN